MNVVFSDNFIKKLPEDNTLALDAICDEYIAFKKIHCDNKDPIEIEEMYSSELINAYALLLAFIESRKINLKDEPPDRLSPDNVTAIKQIHSRFIELSKHIKPKVRSLTLKRAKEKYLQAFNGFLYEFSTGDIKNIKQLIKDLRAQLESCNELDDDHKARVIKKLNDLDSEINIKMTNLDKAYALVIEAQILMHKLGKDGVLHIN